MSRQQWGHGYRRGVAYARQRRLVPRCLAVISVWHWDLRHCWLRNVLHPIRLDRTWKAIIVRDGELCLDDSAPQASLTVLGVTTFWKWR